MTRIRTSSETNKSSDGSDPNACVRCGGRIDDPFTVEHSCCDCGDGGRVRVVVLPEEADLRDYPGAGKSIPCPKCVHVSGITESEMFARSRVPAEYHGYRIETWRPQDSRVVATCREYVATWPAPRPLLLFEGAPGRGKSGMAAGIMYELWAKHGRIGYFTTAIDLLRRYQSTFDEESRTETLDSVRSALAASPLIVLDDLGTESGTAYAKQELYALVNERYSRKMPLVVTTNVALAELEPRIRSRMLSEQHSQRVPFGGPDRRQS